MSARAPSAEHAPFLPAAGVDDDAGFDQASGISFLNASACSSSSPCSSSPPPASHHHHSLRDDLVRQPRRWYQDNKRGYVRLPPHEHRLSISDSVASLDEKASSLSAQSARTTRSCQRRVFGALACAGALFLLVLGVLSQLFRAPPYNLVAPRDYASLLRTFATDEQLSPAQGKPWASAVGGHLEKLSRRLEDREQAARSCPALRQTKLVPYPVASDVLPPAAIPTTMFSPDHELPPADQMERWRSEWQGFGFDPQFITEDEADQFVMDHFGVYNASSSVDAGRQANASSVQSATEHAWRALPRGVLRADFLRYILLLARGGAWADMDVTPLADVREWAKPKVRWVPRADVRAKVGATDVCPPVDAPPAPAEPIRLVVGVECEPWDYLLHSPRGWLELLHILPMNRHREVQFTQWVLYGGAGHPVLLDVLRRLLKADKLFSAYTIANSRGVSYEVAADGSRLAPAKDPHPWTDIRAARHWAPPAPLYPPLSEGGEAGDTPRWLRWRVWPWMWPWPRLGWHGLSVEEWTGPAVWTDAVVSYLYAVGGVRPRDLYGLSHPVQVADVLIAPSSWFNPFPGRFQDAKVVHNFRGSWKHGADALPRSPTKQS